MTTTPPIGTPLRPRFGHGADPELLAYHRETLNRSRAETPLLRTDIVDTYVGAVADLRALPLEWA